MEKIEKRNFRLTLGWLYPRQMSTYGDRGNVLTIWKRAKWRGIEVTVREIGLNERIDPDRFDVYFFGGGQDQDHVAERGAAFQYFAVTRRARMEEGRGQ